MMSSCTSYVLHTHEFIVVVTRSTSRSNIDIAITRSVCIVRRGNTYYRNLGFRGHISNQPNFWFRSWFESSSGVENRNSIRQVSKAMFCT